MPRPRNPQSPFRCCNSSPEVIRLVVMMSVRYPLSLRNVEDLLFERGIDLCHETVRFWWNRFEPMFAGEVTRQRVSRMRGFRQWRWHLDEVYVKIGGEMHYRWRAVHANVHNHLNQKRHLVDRQTYKARRSAALAEWQSLAS